MKSNKTVQIKITRLIDGKKTTEVLNIKPVTSNEADISKDEMKVAEEPNNKLGIRALPKVCIFDFMTTLPPEVKNSDHYICGD